MENKALIEISFEDTSIAFSGKTDQELNKAYWLFSVIHHNWMVKLGSLMVKTALMLRIPVRWVLKPTIFSHFCGGENIEDCSRVVDKLFTFQIGSILDYSVEGKKNEEGLDAVAREIMGTIYKAATHSKKYPYCVFKMTGLAPDYLLEKVSTQQSLNEREYKEWEKVRKRVNSICALAYEKKVRIFFDAEESWIQDAIDQLCYEMMETYNTEEAIVFNTYQLYFHQALAHLKEAYQTAVEKAYFFGAKLVRGAYMEKEREKAKLKGLLDPVQPNKEATDRDFNEAVKFCVDHIDRISFCAGTHNEESSLYLARLMEQHPIAPNDHRVYFAQLLGMSDHISYNLAHAGYNVAKYVPYGPVNSVIPYLLRRAEENTSVAGQSSRELTLVQKEIKRRKKDKKNSTK